MRESPPRQENSYFSSEAGAHILEVIGYVLADGAVTPREVGRMSRAFGAASAGEPREVSAAREAFADRVGKDNGTAEMATLHMHLLSVLALASGTKSTPDRALAKAPEEDIDGIAAGASAVDSVMRDRMSKALDGAVLSLAHPGKKDRFYVFLLEGESPGLYTVAAFYGKKGHPPKESQAKKHPAPLPDARSSFDYAVCGKLRQGYTVDGMTAAGVANKFRYSMEEGTLATHKQLQYIKNLGGLPAPK